jgi:hypothetical protein
LDSSDAGNSSEARAKTAVKTGANGLGSIERILPGPFSSNLAPKVWLFINEDVPIGLAYSSFSMILARPIPTTFVP